MNQLFWELRSPPRELVGHLVRKGGLEPPCLSAPPPQDGVSANFTTSAHWWRGRSQYSRASPAPTLLMERDTKKSARVPDLNACNSHVSGISQRAARTTIRRLQCGVTDSSGK